MKDNFSQQSAEYARFRPGYPTALFAFLYRQCRHFDSAWDCATGNGQIALELAGRFQRVEATDISENQLQNAPSHPKVHYSLQAAEAPEFAADSFDLIVVGQAAHWFDLNRFYEQTRRVLRQDGVLALVGYNMLQVDTGVDAVIQQLYTGVLGTYWDPERLLVDAAYSTLPFPLKEVDFPAMEMTYTWTREQLLGYLGTWSAVQHFSRQNGHTPLDQAFLAALAAAWPDGTEKLVRFPIFGRVGIW